MSETTPVQEKRVPLQFLGLGHARALRDRLCANAIRWQDLPEKEVNQWCECPKDLRKRVDDAQKWHLAHWDGCGTPDWSYLSELADAIEYIEKTERELCKRK